MSVYSADVIRQAFTWQPGSVGPGASREAIETYSKDWNISCWHSAFHLDKFVEVLLKHFPSLVIEYKYVSSLEVLEGYVVLRSKICGVHCRWHNPAENWLLFDWPRRKRLYSDWLKHYSFQPFAKQRQTKHVINSRVAESCSVVLFSVIDKRFIFYFRTRVTNLLPTLPVLVKSTLLFACASLSWTLRLNRKEQCRWWYVLIVVIRFLSLVKMFWIETVSIMLTFYHFLPFDPLNDKFLVRCRRETTDDLVVSSRAQSCLVVSSRV